MLPDMIARTHHLSHSYDLGRHTPSNVLSCMIAEAGIDRHFCYTGCSACMSRGSCGICPCCSPKHALRLNQIACSRRLSHPTIHSLFSSILFYFEPCATIQLTPLSPDIGPHAFEILDANHTTVSSSSATSRWTAKLSSESLGLFALGERRVASIPPVKRGFKVCSPLMSPLLLY